MPLLGVISFFFILPAILGTAFIYTKARQKTRAYRQKRRKYEDLAGSLPRLKDNVFIEADRWPIYARPVLFTDIDHKAQIAFARAQQALSDADQILPQIEDIGEPETPEQFRLNELINIPKNLRTISLGNQIVETISAFEQAIFNLKSSIRSLRTNGEEVEKKRLEIEKSIEKLRTRTEQINKRLKPLDIWKSIEAYNFSWVVSIADRCQLEAYNSIENVLDNEQGYIEYATADIFVNIGDFSLDSIELFLESQKISRRYELDIFFKLFNGATAFLQNILEMDDVWNGWKKLKRVKPEIDKLPQAKQLAEKSLRSFKNRQQQLDKLLDLLGHIAIDEEVKAVDALEKECTYYWYSYTERKTYWEKALDVPAHLPSKKINHLQTLLVTEIYPEIDIDTVIKQSQLLDLIKKIGRALELHANIGLLIGKLQKELNAHKEAERLVNELLDSQGKATLVLADLRMVLEDTSPNILHAGTRLTKDQQIYVERKRRIQGADFPELLESLSQFIFDSQNLIREHRSQLENLNIVHNDLYRRIELLNNELEKYIGYIPKFENQSINYFVEAFNESTSLLNEEKIEKYSWLGPNVEKMQTWVERTSHFIRPERERYNTFERGKVQAEKLLEQSDEELENYKGRVASKWGWYKNEILPKIDSLARSLDRESKEWYRLTERNWSDYNLKRAQSKCDNLIKFCEILLVDLTEAMGKVNQKQNQLNSKLSAVNNLLQINNTKLPTTDKKDIKSLISFAMKETSYESASKLLDHARTIATRRATSRIRDQITHIINVYSQGGSVFFDEVHNEGNIYGATKIKKYFRQKGRKNNEKKR